MTSLKVAQASKRSEGRPTEAQQLYAVERLLAGKEVTVEELIEVKTKKPKDLNLGNRENFFDATS